MRDLHGSLAGLEAGVVERTLAWCGRCRRLAKDFEGSAATEAAWLLVAHLRLLTRRLANATKH